MTYTFNSYEEYSAMWDAVHSGVIYWKKVRQDAQGKICLQVDGTQTHFEEDYAINNIKATCRVLKSIEDSTRPEWDADLNKEVILEGSPFYSAIIYQYLKDEVN